MRTLARDLFFLAFLLPALASGARRVGAVPSPAPPQTYQINPAHTGSVTMPRFGLPLSRLWSVDLGANVSYSLVANGRVFVTRGSNDGNTGGLVALDLATGSILWTQPNAGRQACYDQDTVYSVTLGGDTDAWDAATGNHLWHSVMPIQYSFDSAPTAVGGTLYSDGAGSGGTLYAVNEANGGIIWSRPVMNGMNSSPTVAGGSVFVSYSGPQTYAFDASSGAPIWHFNSGIEGGGGKTTAYYKGYLYDRAAFSGEVFNAASGQLLNLHFDYGPLPAFDADRMHLVSGGTLRTMDAATMAPIWTPSGTGSFSIAPLVINGVVFAGTDQGHVYGFDAATGTQLWHDQVAGSILAPDEQNVSSVLVGMGAGEGVLLVPSQHRLTAYAFSHIDPPAAPSNLSASVAGSRIDLQWVDNSSNEAGFKVERKTDSGAYGLVATVAANSTTYSDSGLAVNHVYSYRVRSTNSGLDSDPSNEAIVTLAGPPPAAPTNLTLTAVRYNEVDLAWVAGDNTASSFTIERKTGNGSYSALAALGSGASSYNDTSVTGGLTYSYRVHASNPGGDSPPSNEVTASPPIGPPGTPLDFHLSAVTAKHVDLAWNAADSNAQNFELERRVGNGSYSLLARVVAQTTTYSDTSVAVGTTYTYHVRATNGAGASSYSGDVIAVTPSPPQAPTGFKASAVLAKRVDLTWDAQPAGVTFRLERKTGSDAYGLLATLDAGATSYSDATVFPATSYSYRLQALNDAGASPYTADLAVNTPAVPPGTPTGLKATSIGSYHVDLAWTPADGNAAQFEIERKSGGDFALLARVSAPAAQYTDPSLLPNTAYVFRVRATNAAGASDYSGVLSLTTPLPSVTPPTSLTATALTATSIRLNWSGATGQDGYKIQRKQGSGAYELLTFVSGNAASYTSTGLAPNTQYTYKVRAYNSVADSEDSPEASAITLPTPLSGLTAAASTAARIDLQWTDPNSPTVSAKIERSTDGVMFQPLGTRAAGQSTYSDTGLLSNTRYTYRVTASGPGGDAEPSATSAALTFPSAPLNLSVQEVTSAHVSLQWTDGSARPSGFRVERSTDGVSFSVLATTALGASSYADSDVVPGGSYQYQVRAVNDTGTSSAAGPVSVSVPQSAGQPPGAPENLAVASVTLTSITLSWKAPEGTITGYSLERSLDGTSDFQQVATPGPSDTLVTSSGLSPGTTYRFRLRASNSAGDGPYSSVVSGTTKVDPPGVPSNLQAVLAGVGEIDLSWKSGGGAVEHFVVERQPGAAAFQVIATVGAAVLTYADRDAHAGTPYHYRVKAIGGGGESGYSNVAEAAYPTGGKLKVTGNLNFGSVTGKATRTLKLTNIGTGALMVTVGTMDGAFRVTAGAGTTSIAPKKSIVVTVQFTPSSKQTYHAQLTLSSTDPGGVTAIPATGKGK